MFTSQKHWPVENKYFNFLNIVSAFQKMTVYSTLLTVPIVSAFQKMTVYSTLLTVPERPQFWSSINTTNGVDFDDSTQWMYCQY